MCVLREITASSVLKSPSVNHRVICCVEHRGIQNIHYIQFVDKMLCGQALTLILCT